MQIHENITRISKSKTSGRGLQIGVYNSGTESVVEIEIAEATQAGTEGCEHEGNIIFARELHAIALRIYVNMSCN